MRAKSSYAPFSVYIRDNLLVVQRTGENGGVRTLCTVDLRRQPTFFLTDAGVMCCDKLGNVFTVESSANGGNDQLLAALSGAQLQQAEKWRSRWGTRLTMAGVLLFVGVMLGVYLAQSREVAPLELGPEVSLAPPPLFLPPALPPHATANTVRPENPVPVQPARTAAPEDGWALPASVRATLPQKLKSAADHQLFTVNYSSGHDRTLYVFADPNCPNCRHLEPVLVAAAHLANVVVFPVAVIGREKSIAAITPVLCLPPEQRPAAWQALFTVGTDGLQLGKQPPVDKKADNACDVAEKALGVNEVAYQAYRIPGTPWVIADDGRYVPQAVLRDPAQLSQFLSQKEMPDATH
ncbi:DsbC family protein [Serratia entomophila]|uniref:DsbC family protein n=1 Tax=Serratia entomophila TaxID=42906 RepID=UPI00217A6619|nr:DsbC family protein [Serratia entomophila]CAI2155846.1 Protein-disulfide isomerase [Serratia entomophila]